MLTKTKKTLLVSLSVLLLVMLTAFGLSETSFSRKSVKADDETATAVAAIGEEKYETLAAAIKAAKDGDTVKLLADCSGNGIRIEAGIFTDKGLTVDFGGYAYTVGGVLVGSSGTGTNAFQLLKDNNITFRDGSIIGVTEGTKPAEDTPDWHGAPAIIIQNYSNLTLKNMVVSGGDETVYTMSNNNGDIVIENTTINVGKAKGYNESGPYAFDVCRFSPYPSVKVTVKGNSVINGDVEVSGTIEEGQDRQLNIEGGEFKGTFNVADTPANITISGGTFSSEIPAEYCDDGYELVANEDGTYGVKSVYAAEVGGTKYATLQEALNLDYSKTVRLLADVKENVTINSNGTTLDLNGFTVNGGTEKGKPTITVNAQATIKDTSTAQTGKVMREDTAENSGVTSHYVIDIQGQGTILFIESGTILNNSGNDKGKGASLIRIGDAANGNNPQLTVKGGKLIQDNFIVIKVDHGYLYVTGGEINSKNTYAVESWGSDSNIEGGTINGKVSSWTLSGNGNARLNISGGTINGNVSAVNYGSATDCIAKVNVTGGTINGKLETYTYDTANKTYIETADKSLATIGVTGGTFSNEVPKEYIAETSAMTENEDGTYTVKSGYVAQIGTTKYETLQAALDVAKSKTVKLLADVNENVTISQYKTTLDLNGFTINGGTAKNKATLTITNNATIVDNSEAQTGMVKREDTAENSDKTSYYVIDIQNGTTIIEGGKFLNNSGKNEGSYGSALISVGDDRYKKYPQLTIRGGTFTQDNFVAIEVVRGTLFVSGGEINTKDNSVYAIENWGTATIKGGKINGNVACLTYSEDDEPNRGNDSSLSITNGIVNGNVRAVNYGETTEKTVKIEITGGTINGALGTYVYNGKYVETPNGTLATIGVTGGTFSEDPSAYLTDAATVKKNADDTFTVEKAYLAKVGETSYYTMDEAFKAQTASKEAIVLLRDYTATKVFNSGSSARVIDLNGHTWTYTQTDNNYAAFEINYSDASVTVKNGTVVSGSMIGLIPSAMSGTITYNNSALVFENVNMTANGHSGFETNGLNTNDAITLKNCTLTVSNGYGIYFPSSGVVTIENTTIIAKTTGVQICSGSLEISGSTKIEVKGEVVAKTENDGAIEDGAAVSVVNRSGYKGLGDVTISGGTFVSTNGAAIKAYSWANKSESAFDNSDKIIAVTGGTFSNKVAAEYCADGFRVAKNGDTYAVVEKYIVSSQVTLGVDISFKYRVEKEGITKVEVSYYGVGATEPTVYELTAENGVYTFTGITPQMIDRKISVTVYVGKYEIYDVVDYSVLDYLKEVLTMNKGDTTDKLVASLAYYGKAAMDYVGYDTAEVEKFITDNALQQSDDEISGVAQSTGKIVKVAVKFDSQNKFVIAVADDVADKYAYTIKVNGKEVENIGWQSGIIDGYKVYLTEGIAARYITEEYFVEVSVKDGDKEVQTLKYNVAGYCANLKGDATFGEMAKATYYYGVAAGEYAKDQNK